MPNIEKDIIHMTLKDGVVVIETRPDLAPKHVAQIKQLISEKQYDGVVFHRVIDGFMAQTGDVKFGNSESKDFDLKFLFAQREALQLERIKLVGQANRLENEANAMIADAEMGDVKFDDEGGEGDTMVVEREQDLVLSAAARQTVEEIDAALARMKTGEYGYSVVSVLPIPKERLRAIPWATELVTERAGGLGRR